MGPVHRTRGFTPADDLSPASWLLPTQENNRAIIAIIYRYLSLNFFHGNEPLQTAGECDISLQDDCGVKHFATTLTGGVMMERSICRKYCHKPNGRMK